ncbi:M23 family metallopeptidase [Mycobacterium sp. AMU20-3851]|uniref:M23 family metallopeptidase n=1 Tax=Mycobacterium sp. AMU20-3851 TaxID=3122055 RepID=UPI0037547ED9
MAEHSSSRSRRGAATTGHSDPSPAEVTDIIPFNEFGDLHELDFRDSSAFDKEQRVIAAPELDDLHDTDDLVPLRLVIPTEFQAGAESEAHRDSSHAYRDSHTDLSDGTALTDVIDMRAHRTGGAHRKQTVGAVKSRLMIAAMAAGATASGAYSLTQSDTTPAADTVLAADNALVNGAAISGSAEGMQIVAVQPVASSAVHAEEITKAAAFAQERAEREARLARPLFAMPTKGVWTSGFGYRWGVLHGGIDIAGPIGTPILAASDGVVVEVGPTAGYGALVKLRHSDGTVTLYGHINTWLVSKGQRVMAGDQIATMGNRGNSTGPHLHFEVLMNGSNRIDPVPWLAQRGLSPGSYVG